MKPAPDAILFDLDGTLADTAPDIAAAIDRMLVDASLPEAGLETVRGWIGNGAERLVERALCWACGQRPRTEQVTVGVGAFLNHYDSRLVAQSRCYPGMTELLKALVDRGFVLGCVTNKPERQARAVLTGLGVAPLFRCVIGGDTTAQKKPSPEPVRRALAELAVAPQHAVLVGDSDNDLLAGAASGVRCIWVSWGYQTQPRVERSYRTADSACDLEAQLVSATLPAGRDGALVEPVQ